MPPDRLQQSQVVQRQHIGALQIKDQKHLRCPAPDPPDVRQAGDHLVVAHPGQARRIDLAVGKMSGQIPKVFDLALGQAAAAQRRSAPQLHGAGRDLAAGAHHAVPDGRCRLERDLLADDRARKRLEGIAPRCQRDPGVTPDDRAQYRVGRRQPAFGALPEGRAQRGRFAPQRRRHVVPPAPSSSTTPCRSRSWRIRSASG